MGIAACQRPLRRSIRVNTLKISVDDFLSLVAPYGWQLAPVPWCAEGFWIEREDDDALPLGSTAEHLSGLFYIQEASSIQPVLGDHGRAPQHRTGFLNIPHPAAMLRGTAQPPPLLIPPLDPQSLSAPRHPPPPPPLRGTPSPRT
ncbi:hypothetical protein NAH03_23815, partial [Stenotrophomonas maltophilia]|uniref:hypothetical protein n=1 Tax=Stenotrophomonas maltophilia TaxID=40324 RepID=UPI00225859DF|nr:hypothetical protein [Stenotrophomonas maltophilia]